MSDTEFFFSSAIDLIDYSLSEQNMNAMYAVFEACTAINQPNKYGPSIQTIMVTAVHQDYPSKFHRPYIDYDSDQKVVQAKVKVNLENVLQSDFLQTITIYQNIILQVLDQIKDQVSNFDFESLKRDLQAAIQEEIKVTE